MLELQAEPRCWRNFTVGLGVSEVLKPDLFVSVAEGDYEHRWFIEVDRGTESARALATKCHAYEAYRRTGIEQNLHEVFPRVLWVVPSEKRARQLRALIDKGNGLTAAMHAMVVDERIDDFRSLLAGGQS